MILLRYGNGMSSLKYTLVGCTQFTHHLTLGNALAHKLKVYGCYKKWRTFTSFAQHAKYLTEKSWIRTVQNTNSVNAQKNNVCTAGTCKQESLKDNDNIHNGPGLEFFIANPNKPLSDTVPRRLLKKVSHPYVHKDDLNGHGQKVYFKVYGCQMNTSDAEVAWAILKDYGYCLADSLKTADIVLIVTCAIREGAEAKIWRQLESLRYLKQSDEEAIKIGVLGCMAERIGADIIKKEKIVDVVVGPDSYKDLPRLLALANDGEKTFNVLLSHDETYANINPVSLSPNKVSAYVSIMRGCDNMCSYCVVPFTRGKERSRDIKSILNEVIYLSERGYKEVTLLGQNVNSYRDTSDVNYAINAATTQEKTALAKGFKSIYKPKVGGRRFADLLDQVSLVNPEMRIRFTSPHPKDFPDEVLHIIKERPNICKHLHLPAQCGSSRVLDLMGRGYTREAYLELVWHIRSVLPQVSLSSDFICGFCGETDEEFEETISLVEAVRYNFCFVFPYSMREKTSAHRNLNDDVPSSVKNERLTRLCSAFRDISLKLNLAQIGQRQLILIEGTSKRSAQHLAGRNDGNTKVIIPDIEVPVGQTEDQRNPSVGDYVEVMISDGSSQVLKGEPLRVSSIQDFEMAALT